MNFWDVSGCSIACAANGYWPISGTAVPGATAGRHIGVINAGLRPENSALRDDLASVETGSLELDLAILVALEVRDIMQAKSQSVIKLECTRIPSNLTTAKQEAE